MSRTIRGGERGKKNNNEKKIYARPWSVHGAAKRRHKHPAAANCEKNVECVEDQPCASDNLTDHRATL